MPAANEAPVRRPPRQLRRRPSEVSISRLSIHPNDSRTSFSGSSNPPSPTSPTASPRAIEISAAFEHVYDRSTTLQTALLGSSEAKVRDQVKKFQGAVTDLFRELQHLPDDIPPTPVLISAIQGCSFEVHCFGSSAGRYHAGCEGWDERRTELAMILNEAMASICALLELAAQAIEDAEAERNQFEESESDIGKAEQCSNSSSGSSTDIRPLSWLVPVDHNSGQLVSPPTESCKLVGAHFHIKELRRKPSLAERLKKISLTNLRKPSVAPRCESSPPLTPNQPTFSRREPLIPTKRPSKGKYDISHLRKSVHFHPHEYTLPLRDSLAIIGRSAPSPPDLPEPNPDDLDAPYVEYNLDGSVKKANLRGLVGVITSGSATEHEEFVSMVLTTFRLFASGRNLADALYTRYTEQQPERLIRKDEMQLEWNMAEKRMKARVATVLHLWLELHWKPEDSDAITRLQQLVGTMEEDRAFHAQSLRISLDRIVTDEGHYGRRFRGEERYRPALSPLPPTAFAARNDLVALASRNPSALTIVHFATPEGVVEFARMITMAESRYYRKLSPEDFVHYKSDRTLKLRRESGEFEQRYKAWIVWTIVSPEDPIERAHVIEFWFEVAKVLKTCLFGSSFENMRLTYGIAWLVLYSAQELQYPIPHNMCIGRPGVRKNGHYSTSELNYPIQECGVDWDCTLGFGATQ